MVAISFYKMVFVISMILSAIYVYIYHKHFDVKLTILFTLIPISCLGYVYMASADNLQVYILSKIIAYIGGCYLEYFMLLIIFDICQIKIHRLIKFVLFVISSLVFISTLFIGRTTHFYKSIEFKRIGDDTIIVREYGILHTVFYVLILSYAFASIIAIIYSLHTKKQISHGILYALFIPDVIAIVSYFTSRIVGTDFESIPLIYILSELVFLFISYRMSLYDIDDSIIDSMIQEGSTALISFDFRNRYLGSNKTAKRIMPELNNLTVDAVLYDNNRFAHRLIHWINSFKKDSGKEFVYTVKKDVIGEDENKIYNVTVNYLFDGRKKRGYIITMTDNTEERKYIELLDKHNDVLKQQVVEKNKHIKDMENEQKKLDTELALASNIQGSILPTVFPPFPDRSEFDIYASMTPARQIGGDFYDFFLVDEDHLCLVIADVSGKGIPASLFMMTSKIILQRTAMHGHSPKDILFKANNQLCSNNQMDMFVTVWVGVLEISTGMLFASSAGHEYPFIKRNGTYEILKDKHGPVMGIMEDSKYHEYSIKLQPGDGIFVYTDGLAEAKNIDNEMYGLERIEESLNSVSTDSCKAMVEHETLNVNAFVGDAPPFDDLTILCMNYYGTTT